MAKNDLLDFFRILSHSGAEANSLIDVLKSMPGTFANELMVVVNTGNKSDLTEWFSRFEDTGHHYRSMNEANFKSIKDPEQKKQAEAFRKLSSADFSNLHGNAIRTAIEEFRSINIFKADIEHSLFTDAVVDVPSLLKASGIKKTDDPTITEFLKNIKRAEEIKALEIESIRNGLLDPDSQFYDSVLDASLKGKSDAEKAKALQDSALNYWKIIYNNDRYYSINRDHLLGKITVDEANDAIEKLKNGHANQNSDTTTATSPKNPNQADSADAEAANNTAGAAANIAPKGFKERSKMIASSAADLYAKVPTKLKVLSVVGAVGAYYGSTFGDKKPQSGDPNEPKDGLQFKTKLADVEDIGDAKSVSNENKELADKLKEDYKKLEDSFQTKLDSIDARIKNTQDPKALEALREVRKQVSSLKDLTLPNKDTPYPELSEKVHRHLAEFDRLHGEIKGMTGDSDLATAKSWLKQQREELNKVHQISNLLKPVLSKIDLAAVEASKGNKPATPLDQDAVKSYQDFTNKQQANAAQAAAQTLQRINNASAPVTTLADAKAKSTDNNNVARIISDHVNKISTEIQKTDKGSIAYDIDQAIAYAEKNGDAAQKQIYEGLKKDFAAYVKDVAETAQNTSEKATEIALSDARVQNISSDRLVGQANNEIAAQGILLKEIYNKNVALDSKLKQFEEAMKQGKPLAQVTAPPPPTLANPQQQQQSGAPGQQQQQSGAPGQQQQSGTNGQKTDPKTDPQAHLPAAIKAIYADAFYYANYNQSANKNTPATLSDGNKLDFGISPRIASTTAEAVATEQQIAKVEQLQIRLRNEGKNAEATSLENSVLLDLRTNLTTLRDTEVALKAAGRGALDELSKINGMTNANQLADAQQSLNVIKNHYKTAEQLTETVKQVKQSNLKLLQSNAVTAQMLKDEISNWQKSPNELLEVIGGGKEGIANQLFGDVNGTGKSVASGYLSLAWQKANDMLDGWKEFGRSQKTQGGRNMWMIADIGGKVVGASMLINLFNNTLGGMAGFKIDGWKSLAILGVVAAMSIHGTGEMGRSMEAETKLRNNQFGSGPLAQTGGTLDISGKQVAGANIPNGGSVSLVNQKTGQVENVASFTKTGSDVKITGANGEVMNVAATDLDKIAKNLNGGKGDNVPMNFDATVAMRAPHSDGVSDASPLTRGNPQSAQPEAKMGP